MTIKHLLTFTLVATIPMMVLAAKPKKLKQDQAVLSEKKEAQTVVEPEPTITEECVINVSLFHESVKNKQYSDAYGPWWEVYTTCPNANRVIYSDGIKIVEALYQATTDPVEKERLATLAIEMQDKRIRYFGNDSKYPTAYILGEKGMAYLDFYGDTKLVEAHDCLQKSVAGMGEESKMINLVKLVDVSYALYKQDPQNKAEQFIADYEMASGFLSQQATDPSNKNAQYAEKQKDYVDNIFAISGAAECSKLDEIYAAVVDENVTNLDMLQKIAKLYKRVRCTESEVYFAACEAAHKLQPTQESAAGCASMSAKKGEYEEAIAYYNQAIEMAKAENEMQDIADYQYNVALYYFANIKDYPQARKYALASIETLTNMDKTEGQGRCYLIIGMAYASSKPYANDAKGAILNKTIYWVAVDKFVKAKQVDPTVTETANEYISSYSKYYPTKEERFDLPNEFSGNTFYVGGWIGETTVIR